MCGFHVGSPLRFAAHRKPRNQRYRKLGLLPATSYYDETRHRGGFQDHLFAGKKSRSDFSRGAVLFSGLPPPPHRSAICTIGGSDFPPSATLESVHSRGEVGVSPEPLLEKLSSSRPVAAGVCPIVVALFRAFLLARSGTRLIPSMKLAALQSSLADKNGTAYRTRRWIARVAAADGFA